MKSTLSLMSVLLLLGAHSAQAEYPERPIRLIISSAAGGSPDVVTRILAVELVKQMGQQIVIDNRPGAAQTIGTEMVVHANPDGYTIGYANVVTLAINKSLLPKQQQSYDPDKDLVLVGQFLSTYNLLAVTNSLPVKSVKELIDYARQNPGKLMNASGGNGTTGHLGGELFKIMTGTQIVHVPYKGGAMAINDLIAGHVHLMFESLNSIAPHARSGKVRALAVTGARRSPAFPDLPTVAEAGVPGYEAGTWSGVIAPAGVPRPIVDRLNAAINGALRSPMFNERFALIGDEPAGGTPEGFAELIRKESAKWAEVVRRSGAKID